LSLAITTTREITSVICTSSLKYILIGLFCLFDARDIGKENLKEWWQES